MMTSSCSPKVTIGLPVFNGAQFIREAIDSALLQSFQDFELLISDNGSSDYTREICEEYLLRDSRVRYVRHDVNRGGHWNFQFVVDEARGNYFTWLAHDDVLAPEFLACCVAILDKDLGVSLVTTDFTVIDETGVFQKHELLAGIRSSIPWATRRIEFFRYPISNVFFSIYGLFRTPVCLDVLHAIPMPKALTGSELPILARVAVKGQIMSIPASLRKYRSHAASAYMRESVENAERPKLDRVLSRLHLLYSLRFDQLSVVATSRLGALAKFLIIGRVCLLYMYQFADKLVRIGPIRMYRRAGGGK